MLSSATARHLSGTSYRCPSDLLTVSTHSNLIYEPICLLIINIHCPLATQRPPAPHHIQALRLTTVRVCMYVCMEIKTGRKQHDTLSTYRYQEDAYISRLFCSVLFFSRPRSEGWSHRGHTFSIYPCPLSFWLTLSWRVLSTSWCCPSRPCVMSSA